MGISILVTGVTGFLGGAFAARLVHTEHSVVAIVRGESADHAMGRVIRSLARFIGPEAAEAAGRSIRLIVGDLTTVETYGSPEFDTITHVVHAAACTSFISQREVWRSNFEGTKCLADRVLKSSRLQRFLHVSTAYCCGDRPEPRVHEADAPRSWHRYLNEYTRSKASAESLLNSMDWQGRLLIARPSVVIGHTRLGIGPSSSLYWYYRALASLHCGPFVLEDRRDIVPVDYVAEALLFLLTLGPQKSGTYHVSAGADGSQALGELLPLVAAETRWNPARWRRVSAATLMDEALAAQNLGRDETEAHRVARGLGACAKFGEIGVQYFDNQRLLSAGFRAPPRFSEYAPVCARTSRGTTIFEQMIDDA